MEDEYNIEQISVDQIAKEYTDDVNNDDAIKNDDINEFNDEKKVKSITKFIVIASVATGSLLLVSSLANDLIEQNKTVTAVVEQFNIVATTNTISYQIVVNDMDAEYLTLNVYNQFTLRKENIILGMNIGTFDNLKENMTYNIDLLEYGIIVKSMKITTK